MNGLVVHRQPRDSVWVGGPDAESYLQGQCSQDITKIDVATSAWSFVLQPSGKVDVLCRVQRVNDHTFVLDTDAGFGTALITRLERFKLRVKLDIAALGWVCLAYRGSGAAERDGLDAWWGGDEARDVLGADVEIDPKAREIDAAAFEHLRVEAGWPAMGAELTPDTIPAESGVVPLAVSFTKGCFTGQELVARIDSRGGHVARHLRRLRRSDGGTLAVGAPLLVEGREVGRVTSASGAVGLGYVARAVDPPALVAVGGGQAEVESIVAPN